MDEIHRLKQIIAGFLKLPADEITDQTVIDRTVLQGSILIHRLYAELAEAGFKVDNYSDIHTFGQLLQKLNIQPQTETADTEKQEQKHLAESKLSHKDTNQPAASPDSSPAAQVTNALSDISLSVGIDIEHVSNFKPAVDYREDEFYRQNFSQREISYCLLQPDPIQSFAGLFAAKEAIVKADNSLNGVQFNKIEILHDANGRPLFQGFQISISHSQDLAVAVAIKIF